MKTSLIFLVLAFFTVGTQSFYVPPERSAAAACLHEHRCHDLLKYLAENDQSRDQNYNLRRNILRDVIDRMVMDQNGKKSFDKRLFNDVNSAFGDIYDTRMG